MKLLLLPFPLSPSPPTPFLSLKGICGNRCRECPRVVPPASFPRDSLGSRWPSPGPHGRGGPGPGRTASSWIPRRHQSARRMGESACACPRACVCVCVPVRVSLGLRICGAGGRQGCLGRVLLWLGDLPSLGPPAPLVGTSPVPGSPTDSEPGLRAAAASWPGGRRGVPEHWPESGRLDPPPPPTQCWACPLRAPLPSDLCFPFLPLSARAYFSYILGHPSAGLSSPGNPGTLCGTQRPHWAKAAPPSWPPTRLHCVA